MCHIEVGTAHDRRDKALKQIVQKPGEIRFFAVGTAAYGVLTSIMGGRFQFLQSSNTQRVAWASVILALALAAPVVADRGSTAPAPERAVPQGTTSRVLDAKGPTQVWIRLKNQDLIGAAIDSLYTPYLNGTDPLTRKAALLVGVRTKAAAIEKQQIAAKLERIRKDAASSLRPASRGAEAVSIRVVKGLRESGARIEQISLAPNMIHARIDARRLEAISKWPEVAAITEAALPELHNIHPADGSAIWHSNGYLGAGAADVGVEGVDSPDTFGGPDLAVIDVGFRGTHNAFSYDATTGFPKNRALEAVSGAASGEHAMAVAGVAAAYDPIEVARPKGLAYGLDRILDPVGAQCTVCWLVGLVYNGEQPAADLPEVSNLSQGGGFSEYDDGSQVTDTMVHVFGISRTGSAGNKHSDPIPQSVSSPGSAYNALSVGAIEDGATSARSDDIITAYSSRGPTPGGRKKPDLVTYGSATCPTYNSDTAWTGNCGDGTSYAAPRVAAGMILLEGVGVFNAAAQKAILINSAESIDSEEDPDSNPETYWRPDVGWGEMALDVAYTDRTNFAMGSITGCCTNNARFFRQDGVEAGARTTLAWELRLTAPFWPFLDQSVVSTLTDLDLFQYTLAGADNDLAPGGVDADEASEDTGLWHTTNDNSDNVEQVRASATGDSIIKVKAASSIDGATQENFSIAGTESISSLETPIPAVTASRSLPLARTGQNITVTAHVTNPSNDLALNTASATLNVPDGVTITSGSATQGLGTVAAGAAVSPAWIVHGTTDGLKQLTVDFSGVAYGETFSGNAATSFTIDGTGPQVSIAAPGPQVGSGDINVNWAGIDSNGVTGYDVEFQVNGGEWQPWISNSTATSGGFLGSHGATYRFRVRATDGLGNTSPYTESTSVLVLSVLPAIEFEAPDELQTGRTDEIKLEYSNAVAPFSVAYSKNSTTPVTIADSKFVVRGPAADTVDHYEISLTDALGRTVSEEFNVRGILLDPSLRFSKPKYARGWLTIAGAFPSDADGRTTIQVRGKVKKKSFSVTKKLKVTRGKFKARLKVRRAALYTVTVRFAGDPRDGYDKTLDVKKFRVRR